MDYLWRQSIGRNVTDNGEKELPKGYHLEEARLPDVTEKVYLMNTGREVASWDITQNGPKGSEILEAAYNDLKKMRSLHKWDGGLERN